MGLFSSSGVSGSSLLNTGSNWGTDITNTVGFTNPNAKNAQNQLSQNQQQEYQSNQGILGQMNTGNNQNLQQQQNLAQGYETGQNKNTAAYMGQNEALQQQVQNQATNARQTYSNTILPAQQQAMEQAQQGAKGAMTLQQAMNPNNSVATAVQNQYNQQGQAANAQGLADVGMLQAMGSQATGQSMQSGQPMTGGQLAAIQGMNQSQAGQAMANTQAYIQNLRTQGLQAGQQQSNLAFQQGQQAQQNNQNAIGQYSNLYGQGQNQVSGLEGQLSGLQGQDYNVASANNLNQYQVNQGLSNLQNQYTQQNLQNQMGNNQILYGQQQGQDIANIQAANANAAGRANAFGGILGAGIGYASSAGSNAASAASGGGAGAMTGAAGGGGGGGSTMQSVAQGAQMGEGIMGGLAGTQGVPSYSLTGPSQGVSRNGGGANYSPGVPTNGGGAMYGMQQGAQMGQGIMGGLARYQGYQPKNPYAYGQVA